MKLYATTTSERATKGQGGNDFLRIEIKDETESVIMELNVKPSKDDSKTIIDGYVIHPHHDGKRSEQYYRYEVSKGNKQKG